MRKYRPDIDGLRALAVAPVVLNHAGVPGFSGGFVGVDVFFVISGYLITGILADEMRDGSFSLSHFYERRVRRILPALFAVILACLVVGYFRFLPEIYDTVAQGVLATLLFASNIWFWSESVNYFAASTAKNPLLHTWSLAVEEQFYIVFPPLLWALMSWRRGWTLPVVALIAILSFFASIWAVRHVPQSAFFLSQFRIWELAIGALLALLVLREVPQWLASIVGVAGLLAIVSAVTLYAKGTPFPGLAAALPCLGAAAVIWAGQVAPRGAAARLLSWAPFVWIGLISYSLYLWHWPVLAYTRVMRSSTELPIETALLCVLVSVVLAFLSWRFVERPFRKRRVLQGKRSLIWTMGASGAALFVAAGIVDQTRGLPERLTEDVRQAISAYQIWDVPVACRDGDFRKPACINKEGPIDVLFWGDSHTGTLWSTMARLSDARELVAATATKQGCAPVTGVIPENVPARVKECYRHNQNILDDIIGHEDIRMVVLYARWPATKFDLGLKHSVQAMTASGRDVVLIGGTPNVGWHVRHAMSTELFIGRPLPKPPSRAEALADHARSHELLSEIGSWENVTYLPVVEEICEVDCPVTQDGKPLYNDDNHLNRWGAARFIAPVIAPSLDRLSRQ